MAAFDRSWRVGDSGGTIGGFGLGLAIVRQLVVTDRGEVELLEAEGGGLDVCVRLAAATAPRRRPIVVRRPEGDGSSASGAATSPEAHVGELVAN